MRREKAVDSDAIEKLWREEESLSVEERRRRYKCKDKYVKLEDIPTWAVYLDELRAKKEDEVKEEVAEKSKEGQDEKDVKPKGEVEEEEKPKDEEKKKKKKDPAKVAKKLEREIKKKAVEEVDREKELEDTTALFPPDEELNSLVSLWRGDITSLEIDAVVNAAKRSLLGGGGIDGAIHRAAGQKLVKECAKLGGCPTGGCRATRGYNLPAKIVLHTVGPIGERPKKLRECYTNCLEVATCNGVRTLAFCGISTGIYGYPLYRATHIALDSVRRWLDKGDNRKKVDRIIFCVFLAKEKDCYELMMAKYFPRTGDAYKPLSLEEEKEMLLREELFEEEYEDEDDETSGQDSNGNGFFYAMVLAAIVIGGYMLVKYSSTFAK